MTGKTGVLRLRYLTGLLEVAGGIGLPTSRSALYAAVLLATVMPEYLLNDRF